MAGEDMLDYGKSAAPRTALVNAVESLKYGPGVPSHAYSVILDGELHLAVEGTADIDNHISALILVIVADSVVTQVVEHLFLYKR